MPDFIGLVTTEGASILRLAQDGFQTIKLEGCQTADYSIVQLSYLSQNRYIAGSNGEIICLWEVDPSRLIANIRKSLSVGNHRYIALSQESPIVAIVSDELISIHAYDQASDTWQIKSQFSGNWREVEYVEFTQGQRFLFIVTGAGLIKSIPLEPTTLIDRACQYLSIKPLGSGENFYLTDLEALQDLDGCNFDTYGG